MKKKLLTIILSILLCISVVPNKIIYADSINRIDLEDTIPADLGDFYGKPYEKMNEEICLGIKYASISGINPNAVDITITPSGDLETLFMERQPYTVLVSLSCLEGYFFELDNDFYMNIIKPTPSQVIVNDNQNSIGITYTYNEEGFLDNSGGGSSDAIDSIDLSGAIPDFSTYKNKTAGELIEDVSSSNFGDLRLFSNGDVKAISCKRVLNREYDVEYSEVPSEEYFESSFQYVLELIFVDDKEFACEWNYEKNKYVYSGSFLPEMVGTSLIVGQASIHWETNKPTVNSYEGCEKRAIQILIPIDFDGGGSSTGSIEEMNLSSMFTLPQYIQLINRTYQEVEAFNNLQWLSVNYSTYIGYKIWNQTDNEKMEYYDRFESGKCYVLSIFYRAQDGYNYNSLNINNINPKPNAIKKGIYDENEGQPKIEDTEGKQTAIELMYCFYDNTNPYYINTIDLSGFDIGNYKGMTAGDVIELADSINFSQSHMSLLNNVDMPSVVFERITSMENYKELEPEDDFEKGEQYMMTILLEADEGYSFPYFTVDYSDNYAGSCILSERVSEQYVKVGDCVNEILNLGGKQYHNGVCIQCIFNIDDIPVNNINLSKVIPNDFSQYEDLKSSSLLSGADIWNFGELIKKGALCYEKVNNIFTLMNSTKSFEAGKEYKLELFLQAPEGKIFSCDYDTNKNGYVYNGSFLPNNLGTIFVGEIKGTGNNICLDVSKDKTDFTNPKNGIMLSIPFTVGEAVPVVEISSWDQLEAALYVDPMESDPPAQNLAFKLVSDITADTNTANTEDLASAIYIHRNQNVKIDLNGHIMDRNLVNYTGSIGGGSCKDIYGSVFYVEGKLKITDSNPTVEHKGYTYMGKVWCSDSELEIAPGEIKEEIERWSESKTIYGGIITGGVGLWDSYRTNPEYGGGIYINSGYPNATVVMNGGTICGNIALKGGGGVAIRCDYDIPLDNAGKFIMNGGTICNNFADGDSQSAQGCGGGIFVRHGTVIIDNGHIEENSAVEHGGGICSDQTDAITIMSGTVNNNSAKYQGAISCNGYQSQLNLLAVDGKEIVITGNKSEMKGNVSAENIYFSGKVIINGNTSTAPFKMSKKTGNAYYPDPYRSSIDPETGQPIYVYPTDDLAMGESPIQYLDALYYANDLYLEVYGRPTLHVVGDLSGSNIKLSTINVFEYNFETQTVSGINREIITDYITYNPGAKLDTYFHHAGPDNCHLELKNGSIYVGSNKVDEKSVNNTDSFKEALDDAKELLDDDPYSKVKIKLSEDIIFGDDDNKGFDTPPNTEIDLGGHDIKSKGPVEFFGDVKDSGGEEDEDGNKDKGKIYLTKPEDLYIPPKEADDDDETYGEPVWTEVTEDPYVGYYCIYQVGAKTKWAEIENVDSADAAKFKVQPTAYDELLSLLQDEKYSDVYGNGKKVKVGLRLILDNSRNVNFVFDDSLTSKWASGSEGLPTEKCMSVKIKGLKPFKSVVGQAAIYSKPDDKIINARFFSNNNDRDE